MKKTAALLLFGSLYYQSNARFSIQDQVNANMLAQEDEVEATVDEVAVDEDLVADLEIDLPSDSVELSLMMWLEVLTSTKETTPKLTITETSQSIIARTLTNTPMMSFKQTSPQSLKRAMKLSMKLWLLLKAHRNNKPNSKLPLKPPWKELKTMHQVKLPTQFLTQHLKSW